MKTVVLIGYSGHAYVVADILHQQQYTITGYMENAAKAYNPYNLEYLGTENDLTSTSIFAHNSFIVAIGNNEIRKHIFNDLINRAFIAVNAIHPKATIGFGTEINTGVTIMAGAIINPLAKIGAGAIINTGAIIEHECLIGNFVHIAPGAVLAGNVSVGENSFIGSNAVIKQGVKIGANVIIGAGAVVLKDISDGNIVYGNPARNK